MEDRIQSPSDADNEMEMIFHLRMEAMEVCLLGQFGGAMMLFGSLVGYTKNESY